MKSPKFPSGCCAPWKQTRLPKIAKRKPKKPKHDRLPDSAIKIGLVVKLCTMWPRGLQINTDCKTRCDLSDFPTLLRRRAARRERSNRHGLERTAYPIPIGPRQEQWF